MEIYDKALELAKKAHKGQFDRSGMPYINHPLWVQSKLSTINEKVVGILHDVVEDTDITLDDISKEFGKEIRDACDAITKREGEDYLGFIERCMQNDLAKRVKIMDIRHNMDLSRSKEEPKDEDFWRLENKYKPAYRMLTGHNLFLSEQIDSNLNDFELKHMIWNLYTKRDLYDRINRNMEYILKGYTNAISDELKEYLEGELAK